MSMTFSAAAIAALVFDIVFAITLPVGMLLYLRKRYGCGLKCFFIGAGVFLLFVLVLENLAHAGVAASPLKPVLMGENYWAFGLYGGLMAGLFEELGRFAAFQTVLKKQRDKDYNALMYGAGHGGIEVMIVMLPTMITYLVYAILLNTGNGAVLTSGMDAATMETVQTTMQSVAALPAWQLLISPVERIAAVIAHLSLSVIVWFAVKNHRAAYLLLAIVLHALLDAVTVILNYSLGSILIVECGAWVIALCIAVIARRIWKQNSCAAVDMG